MRKLILLVLIAMVAFGSFGMAAAQDDTIIIGSKDFAEQRFLGNVIFVALQEAGLSVESQVPFGPTAVVRDALVTGEIDIYAEYTATAAIQHLPAQGILVPEGVAGNAYESYAVVASLDSAYNDLVWLRNAPANNTYTMAARREFAEENNLVTFADVAEYVNNNPDTRLISNEEFTSREDGLATFENTYGFEFNRDNIESLPGAVTSQPQQQLRAQPDSYEFSVAYGTDGTLATFDLVIFEDPDGAQPIYQPAPVVRGEVLRGNPQIADILNPIFTTMDAATLQLWNSYVAEGVNAAGDPASAEDIAREYLVEFGFLDG